MKTVVSLHLSKLNVLSKIEKARFIIANIGSSTYFTAPIPHLVDVDEAALALEAAHQATRTGGAEEISNLHVKEAALEHALKSLAAHVETVANAHLVDAETIVLSAGMNVKGKGGARTTTFDVRPTGNDGEIKVMCKGVPRAIYEIQMTTDPSQEANWHRIYSGTRSRFVKTGLTSGTRYYFRACSTNKDGVSPWSIVLNKVAL